MYEEKKKYFLKGLKTKRAIKGVLVECMQYTNP
jgi:hypothetical protein